MEIAFSMDDNTLRVGSISHPCEPLERSGDVMRLVLEKLKENKAISRIVLVRKMMHEYDYDTTRALVNLAARLEYIEGRHMLDEKNPYFLEGKALADQACSDPVGAFVLVSRELRRESLRERKDRQRDEYIGFMESMKSELLKTELIKRALPYTDGLKVGDRRIYDDIISYKMRPGFSLTSIMYKFPKGSQEVESYPVGESEVTILKVPGRIRYLYHMIPTEINLSEKELRVIELIKRTLEKYKPLKETVTEPSRIRKIFYDVSRDIAIEYMTKLKLNISDAQIEKIASAVTRETAGFGVIENLVEDEKIQDILINSPVGSVPVYIYHADHEECETNLYPSLSEATSWASKLKMISGRPLDEANPVLDCSLDLPNATLRVAGITSPLSPSGLAFAFRRHRERPWTYPLMIYNRMMNAEAAGLMSFMIDNARTFLIGGTRSAGKTSVLGASMVEIMRKYRIILVEDTLELPSNYLRSLDYNIQSLKVRSPIRSIESELSATDGIRTALRLGDSVLIMGEVRSNEAVALYEAMRIGALANVVAGTIHGESAYGIFDRVVNDLGVKPTSFKATDLIMICNPIKSPDGLHRWRRVVSITEVGKKWKSDPLMEDAFNDLMVFDTKKDSLVPTEYLLSGKSEVIKNISKVVRGWDKWEDIWENIRLRARYKEALVRYAESVKKPQMMESDFVVRANDEFRGAMDAVNSETGKPDPKRVYSLWESWLKSELKKI